MMAAPPARHPLRSTALRALAVMLVLAVLVALGFVIVRGYIVVLALFGAIVIGESLRPPVDRLGSRMPRPAAIVIVFLVLLAVLAALWVAPVQAIAPQATAFWADLPRIIASLGARPVDASIMGPLAEGFLHVQTSVVQVISTLGLTLVMAGFWLGSSPALAPFVLSLVPPVRRAELVGVVREIGGNLGSYVTGTVVNGALVFVECAVVLALLRTPFPVVLGLLQGLLIALPYVGTLIGVLAVGAVVLVAQGWLHALVAMLAVALAQTLQGTFVAPLIFKKGLDIDPLLTVFAIAIGGALFGFFGVLLAVPAASVLQTIVVRVVAPEIRSSYAQPLPEDLV